MAQTINTNLSSMTAQRNQAKTQGELATAINRLSSGLRINSAKDDAAGMAISERMTSQIRGLKQAARNANDGISLAQVAEGALGSVGTNLQRMRELAVQSANATNSTSDRAALQQEVAQLAAEIDRVATQTQFNGLPLLDGTYISQQYQVGANAGQTITVSGISSARSSALGQFQGFAATTLAVTANETPAITAVQVGTGGANVSLGTIKADARDIAAAINASGVSGLTASANTSVVGAAAQSIGTTGVGGAVTISVNGIAMTVTATTNAATNRANAVAALNAQSSVTGVVATDTGSGVSLASVDGRNILTAFTAGAGGASSTTMADFGMTAAGLAASAGVTLAYVAPTGITGTLTFTGSLVAAPVVGATGTAVSALNISTVAGANNALSAIDAALTTVNSNRAALGAVQNRFSSTIENLQTSGENLSASRSRIQDADFAAETAALSRAQILQQAGTAMIAQANQLPQQVLALLK